MLLLVSCIIAHNHLLYFARLCARSTTKIANKNMQQRPLEGFITISLYYELSSRGGGGGVPLYMGYIGGRGPKGGVF